MAKLNFLLGKGERLTEPVVVRSGPVDKHAPYTFAEVKARLSPMLDRAVAAVQELPREACPDDRAAASVLLNPEYLAKSYYPAELFQEAGVTVVGSRPRRITPRARSRARKPEETITTEFFVMGPRACFRDWQHSLPNWSEGTRIGDDLMTIEEIAVPGARDKIKGALPVKGDAVLEVVLHSDELGGSRMLPEFRRYLKTLGLDHDIDQTFYASGLCFLELDAPVELAEQIATFAAVRALREMPRLRVLRPAIRTSGIATESIVLPTASAVDPTIRVAIFDGGLPDRHPITAWATPIAASDVGKGHKELARHGLGVTSAFLFGHVTPGMQPGRPFANVDHYRVLDLNPGQNKYELYEVLARIDHVLASKPYDFVNLSIGPELAIEDDDVHAWTAVLDDRLSRCDTLATIAVGNSGEGDAETALNRIQVPADCVNAIGVGAVDRLDEGWRRATYSSIGPGRSPGMTKPDLVDFGGSMERPFLVLAEGGASVLEPTGGTSFAAPSLLRLGAGIRAHLGSALNLLAVRALLVHTAEASEHPRREVGWGRVARTLDDIVLCDDDTIRVLYQGTIPPAKFVRARIPVSSEPLEGMVEITATLCHKSKTDPHHPGTYTRSGLSMTFRPHDGKFRDDKQHHANSKSFVSLPHGSGDGDLLRRDGVQWENVQHGCKRLMAKSLSNPCFDIHYNSRLEGRSFEPEDELQYALVVTLRARKVSDLYDRVIRQYGTILEAMRPVIDIPVRT
jgi:hypothetical protein